MIKICKLAVDIGHNMPFDGGAVGIRRESELNYEVGTKFMGKCRAAGIEVVDCTPRNVKSLYDSLNKRVAAANGSNADFFISIHHNASLGGAGTEVLCIKGGEAERVGNIILGEIVKLGFRNRGVKDRRDLFVINRTRMPAIIVECAFCDSLVDMRNYDTGRMARAIFEGICKAFVIVEDGDDSGAVYHTVVKDDTLTGLARKYGTTVRSIVELNGIGDADYIVVGEKLKIK